MAKGLTTFIASPEKPMMYERRNRLSVPVQISGMGITSRVTWVVSESKRKQEIAGNTNQSNGAKPDVSPFSWLQGLDCTSSLASERDASVGIEERRYRSAA
jgi:hypothetical protein